MTNTWLGTSRQDLAATRILDAAGELFARDGVEVVGMGDVAKAAGCSRATLYRYFPNRDSLRMAFVQRSASRLGAELAGRVAHIEDSAEQLETAVLQAVAAVRADPLLATWFNPASAGIAADIASGSEVIEALAEEFLADRESVAGAKAGDAARWTVRTVVSLLSMPGRDADEERRFVRNVLVPAVLSPHTNDTHTQIQKRETWSASSRPPQRSADPLARSSWSGANCPARQGPPGGPRSGLS